MKQLQFLNAIALILVAIMVLTSGSSDNAAQHSVRARAARYRSRIIPIMYNVESVAGTGVFVKLPSGQSGILTNAHVCNGVAAYSKDTIVKVDDKPVYDARILRISVKDDLCVLLSKKLLTHENFKVKDTHNFALGEVLLVMGYPLGGSLTPQQGFYVDDVNAQIVFTVDENKDCVAGQLVVSPFGTFCVMSQLLEATTVPIYPGNSGSPVFNDDEDLVGLINSADNRTNQGNFITGTVITQFLKGL